MGKFTRISLTSLIGMFLISVVYILSGIVGLIFIGVFVGFILGIASSDVLELIVGGILTLMLSILSSIVLLIAEKVPTEELTAHLSNILLVMPFVVIVPMILIYLIFKRIAAY